MIHACASAARRDRRRQRLHDDEEDADGDERDDVGDVVSVHSAPRRRRRCASARGRQWTAAVSGRTLRGQAQPPRSGSRRITSSASSGSSLTCSAWPSPVETIAEVARGPARRGTPRRHPAPLRDPPWSTRRAWCDRCGPSARDATSVASLRELGWGFKTRPMAHVRGADSGGTSLPADAALELVRGADGVLVRGQIGNPPHDAAPAAI